MSTRGLVGFVVNETPKLTYNHFDSYPSGLGEDVLKFLKTALGGEGLAGLRERATALKALPEDATDAQNEAAYETRGNLEALLSLGSFIDSAEFAKNSLFCEWGYVLDLDAEVFEVYRGFQTSRHSKGRFAADEPDDSGYYPIRPCASYPFAELPEDLSSLESSDDE